MEGGEWNVIGSVRVVLFRCKLVERKPSYTAETRPCDLSIFAKLGVNLE